MKVWKLALSLLWHTVCGRGGDKVYLRLEGMSLEAEAEQNGWNWELSHWSSPGRRDAFTILVAEPEGSRR